MIKKGEILVCVDNTVSATSLETVDLTCNNKYTMLGWYNTHHRMLYVQNDMGITLAYMIDRFMTLTKYRRLKLNKLCSKKVMK